MGKAKQVIPTCDRAACRAWFEGECTALNNNDFKGRPCPFFKKKISVKKEEKK